MRKWITTNLGIKVLSFFTALLLWFHVITERDYEETVSVPVRCINQGEHILLTKKPPEFVEVKIRGKGKELLRFGRTPKVVLDLKKLELGWKRIDLKKEDITFPYESKIEVVSEPEPKNFIIRLERRVIKDVQIVPNLKSECKCKVIPEILRISGGSDVYAISTVTTEEIGVPSKFPESLKVKLELPEGIETALDSVLVILLGP